MSADARSKIEDSFYEVLPTILEESGEAELTATYTANNGIRIHIEEFDDDDGGSFDFTAEQAEMVGQALVRWAQRDRAETELLRCGWIVRKP